MAATLRSLERAHLVFAKLRRPVRGQRGVRGTRDGMRVSKEDLSVEYQLSCYDAAMSAKFEMLSPIVLSRPRNLAAAIILCVAPCVVLHAQNYTFQNINCGDNVTQPSAINNQGVIVGSTYPFDARFSGGMLVRKGVCENEIKIGLGDSFQGVNDAGQIIADIAILNAEGQASSNQYVIGRGTPSLLPPYPGAASTAYRCLNNSGVLAGNYQPSGTYLSPSYGFVYQNGEFIAFPYNDLDIPTIYGLNNNGLAVGTIQTANNREFGFTFKNGKSEYFAHPGSEFTMFYGINDNGLVVGTFGSNDGPSGLFTYDLQSGIWTDLNFPEEYVSSTPVGINNAGVIALQATPSGGLATATPSEN